MYLRCGKKSVQIFMREFESCQLLKKNKRKILSNGSPKETKYIYVGYKNKKNLQSADSRSPSLAPLSHSLCNLSSECRRNLEASSSSIS